MKKLITAFTLGLFMVTATPIISFAGNHGCHARKQPACSVCTFEDCHDMETHQHDGTFYAGHTLNDGHQHQVCSIESCTQTGTHDHDGHTYFEHHDEDGHDYHRRRNTSGDHNQHHRSGRHHS